METIGPVLVGAVLGAFLLAAAVYFAIRSPSHIKRTPGSKWENTNGNSFYNGDHQSRGD